MSVYTFEPSLLCDHSALISSTFVRSRRHAASHKEMIIPLASDSAFFSLLAAALQQLSAHLLTLRVQFEQTLHELSRTISSAARPMSEAGRDSFVPHSVLSDPTEPVSFTAAPAYAFFHHSHEGKSDLYAWREIFQLYLDAEIFESTSERSRGERSVEDASDRLQAFVDRLKERHLWDEAWLEDKGHLKHETGRLQLKESRKAMVMFLRMNETLLDLKKVRVHPLATASALMVLHRSFNTPMWRPCARY